MSTVARHLFCVYRTVYVWFLSLFLFAMVMLALSFSVFGNYRLDDERASVWESVGLQGPRWFLFVMGIMWATTNLPIVVANGITRRRFFRGAMEFALASAVTFGLLMLAGFGAERIAFSANGTMDEITDYPLMTWGQAGWFGVEIVISGLLFILCGWIVGLLFYRLNVWVALLCLPFGMIPVAGGVIIGNNRTWDWGIPAALVILVLAAVAGYLLVRDVAIRPKKA